MRNLILVFCLFVSTCLNAQKLPDITDTVNVNSWEEAMSLTFGLLPKSHYPTGFLLNKANPLPKLVYANGLLNDSSFNMLDFYYLQNSIRLSNNNPDSIKGYLVLDSIKEKYIEANNVLPWGVINITGDIIKDSAFKDGSISVLNHRLVENNADLSKIYTTKKMFCVAPLDMEIFTLNPHFIIKPEYIFANNTNKITAIEVDLDDGLGYRNISVNSTFEASYNSGGYKNFISRIIDSAGDTLYSRSELNVVDNNLQRALSSSYQPYDDFYTISVGGPNHSNLGTYPTEFSEPLDYNKFVEVGVWYGCGNVNKKLRKPLIVFGGYNPKDGKTLTGNDNPPWVNASFGAAGAGFFDFLEGWRGPMYETYNGFYTDASKNAGGGNSFGSNGNNFLDKVRAEGYDVLIVRFRDGIGYIQNNAFLVSLVLKDINDKILSGSDNVYNPGADLDPEAPGYPNTTLIKKAKHELVIVGYSAGAMASRMGLLLMEYEHEIYKCPINQSQMSAKARSTVHRTKIWVGIDHEAEGSNSPIGMQMFMDFQKSVWYLPANIGDIVNSLICSQALQLLQHKGVATQNTLYHIDNMYSQGSGNWNVGHHSDYDRYYQDLARITPTNYPGNLKGYPKNCYRIGVSQGNANGITQVLNNNTNLLFNQSPSSWCVSPAGTWLGIGNFALKITPFREATARVLSSWNNEAFSCKIGTSVRTLFYSWHINFGHWKYFSHNYINDQDLGTYQNYDETAASTLPSHIILAKNLLSSPNTATAAFTICNLEGWNSNQHGFSPTVSGLDLHLPNNLNFPRLPNLKLIPGNVSGGLNLMMINDYNNVLNSSPNKNFGYPYLTFPANHYDYTPLDAIWANTTNNVNYDNNTIHIEDPNPEIGVFLTEEIAPYTLYLSNRTIQGDIYSCGSDAEYTEKYYADFEARNSVLAGNQDIYKHNLYDRVRTSAGDFIVGKGGVVTFRANNFNGQSSVVLGAGFSAKEGSIFRAYVFTDPNMCAPFSYSR